MIDLTFIVNSFTGYLNDLMYSLTPFVALYISLRLALGILTAVGNTITGAFSAENEPLSRKNFEAKYGPISDELVQEAGGIRAMVQPVDRLYTPFFAILSCLILASGVMVCAAQPRSPQMAQSLILMLAFWVASLVVLIVWMAHTTRVIGHQRRAWKAKVRERYGVAENERITLRIARRARASG